MTPAQRKLRAQMGAETLWAKTPKSQRSVISAPGRLAAEARFERDVREQFPDLPDDEVIQLAQNARKAFYRGIQLKSAKTRAARAAGAKKQ
jgi:hypothetical protein